MDFINCIKSHRGIKRCIDHPIDTTDIDIIMALVTFGYERSRTSDSRRKNFNCFLLEDGGDTR